MLFLFQILVIYALIFVVLLIRKMAEVLALVLSGVQMYGFVIGVGPRIFFWKSVPFSCGMFLEVNAFPILFFKIRLRETEEVRMNNNSILSKLFMRSFSPAVCGGLAATFWYGVILQHGAKSIGLFEIVAMGACFIFGFSVAAGYVMFLPLTWIAGVFMYLDYAKDGIFQPNLFVWFVDVVHSVSWRGLPDLLCNLFYFVVPLFTLPLPGSDGLAMVKDYWRVAVRFMKGLEYAMFD